MLILKILFLIEVVVVVRIDCSELIDPHLYISSLLVDMSISTRIP